MFAPVIANNAVCDCNYLQLTIIQTNLFCMIVGCGSKLNIIANIIICDHNIHNLKFNSIANRNVCDQNSQFTIIANTKCMFETTKQAPAGRQPELGSTTYLPLLATKHSAICS